MSDDERNKIIELCARVAESVHGLEEGDIRQHVFAGHRIAREIRNLKARAGSDR